MLQLRSVLGLGTLEAAGERSKSPIGAVVDALKNPVHAALIASAYLIWFLTTKVDASQEAIKMQVAAQSAAINALSQSDAQRVAHEREHDQLLRMICRGVNKGDAKEKCDQ